MLISQTTVSIEEVQYPFQVMVIPITMTNLSFTPVMLMRKENQNMKATSLTEYL